MSDLTEYYTILEIPVNSSQPEVLKAYRKLSKKYHPGNNPTYENKFMQISQAFKKLFHEDIVYEDGFVLTNNKLLGKNF